ncbi:response regulator [Mesorhizobium sp. M7D.F.Ca.US.005.01.1.1]|jgi:DNA-binding response OmpR family regulator|uniref:response regulator n=1 Tax=Mesorhizobium sp. M7D.F.Ca.US.005.01.1.1 TaxID=2493678 RepID=UPI000F7609E9|nr:response regulator [Mesorhizobium sp. M7D.F.Ca.US.005.01.1.1]AZO45622.1 response regulator [Mesorhizobium sp. M7D.F.Ca.US.005.01.1.1]
MDGRATASIVLLEDEALIALDIADQLQNAGFAIAETFSTCAAALEWLSVHTPDLAILDIQLRDGDCEEVAKALNERKVPFVVHSGMFPGADGHSSIFLKGEWITKPSAPEDLTKAVKALLASRNALKARQPRKRRAGGHNPGRTAAGANKWLQTISQQDD